MKIVSGTANFSRSVISPQTMTLLRRQQETTATSGLSKTKETLPSKHWADLARHSLATIQAASSASIAEKKRARVEKQMTYPRPEGGVANKKFPISIYGEVGALRLAIQARRAGLLVALGSRSIATDETAYAVIRFYDDILANLQDYNDQSSIYRSSRSLEIRTSLLPQSLSNY